MVKARENLVGAWAFLVGVILAVVIGIIPSIGISLSSTTSATISGLLVLMGLLVGLLNIGNRDVGTFLLAAVSLVIVSFAGLNVISGAEILAFPLGDLVKNIFNAMLALFIPAAIVVALKSVFSIAKV